MPTSAKVTSREPAEVYEECFVPAFFAGWGKTVARRAQIEPPLRVLDVACGTGALTRAALERTAGRGSVVGLDPNPAMLAVAKRVVPGAELVEGRAEQLPFEDGSFDRVVSQFGLMFFEDAARALREMRRVLAPRGRLVVAVCDGVDHSPCYSVLAELLQRLFGPGVAESFRAPFALGDPARLTELCEQAGLSDFRVSRCEGKACFSSVARLIQTEGACVWTLGGVLDPDQVATLQRAAEESLSPFASDGGMLEFDVPSLLIEA